MNASGLLAVPPMLLVGAMFWLKPLVTRPTLQFGVRVPAERAGAPVIRRERRAYRLRTAVLVVGLAATTMLVPRGSPWLALVPASLELPAILGCFWLARARITAVKNAEGWFDGLTQTVTADTTWRTDPLRFPRLWLVPATAVLVATAVTGAVRYPGLPARLAVHFTASGAPDRWAGKSAWSAFYLVAGQLLVTILVTVQQVIIYRSRPEIDAGNAADATLRYRRYLARISRTVLAFAALENVGLMLAALQVWRVYRLPGIGSAVTALPATAGALILLAVALRMGQAGYRLPGFAAGPGSAGGVTRDDDRFWKGGLIYVNHDDPAIIVGKRFGIGWTLNFGSVRAWLLFGGMVAVGAVLVLTSLGP
jgi:uncharacterized membrane protein